MSSNLKNKGEKSAHLMTKWNIKANMDILGLARAIPDLFICTIHVSW